MPSSRAETAPACQSESVHIASSPCSFQAHLSVHNSTPLRTSSGETAAALSPERRAGSGGLSSSLTARPAFPSAKALGKRKNREGDARCSEDGGSPSKLSRLSAWRKHAGRYILTPVLGRAREVDEPPTLPVTTSDYDASSEGSSQRSSTSPPPDAEATRPPLASLLASRSDPFKFISKRPPVCSPAPSYANILYQPFPPGPSQPVSSRTRRGRRSQPPMSSPHATATAIFSPRTRRVPPASLAATASPRAQFEPKTRLTILPALSVSVRNFALPSGASLGTPFGHSRLFGTASPVHRSLRKSRILPAGTAEPCSSLGSGTIIFFNEMNEIRAYRVAPDIHSYAEKFVRTRPVPTPGTRTPMLRSTHLPREPVRCITPEVLPCATPDPLDIFPERHSPQPSSSGDSAATLYTYSPQLSTSLTLVNDSDETPF